MEAIGEADENNLKLHLGFSLNGGRFRKGARRDGVELMHEPAHHHVSPPGRAILDWLKEKCFFEMSEMKPPPTCG